MKIHVNRIDLFFEMAGEGIPIILLHGYPLDHSIWNQVMQSLGKKGKSLLLI